MFTRLVVASLILTSTLGAIAVQAEENECAVPTLAMMALSNQLPIELNAFVPVPYHVTYMVDENGTTSEWTSDEAGTTFWRASGPEGHALVLLHTDDAYGVVVAGHDRWMIDGEFVNGGLCFSTEAVAYSGSFQPDANDGRAAPVMNQYLPGEITATMLVATLEQLLTSTFPPGTLNVDEGTWAMLYGLAETIDELPGDDPMILEYLAALIAAIIDMIPEDDIMEIVDMIIDLIVTGGPGAIQTVVDLATMVVDLVLDTVPTVDPDDINGLIARIGDIANNADTCAPAHTLMVCAVGDSTFCDPLGAQAAFDKMAAIVFESYYAYELQTAAKMNVAFLKCYLGGDPFDYNQDYVVAFEADEYHRPATEANIMHRFTDGGGGAGWCHSNWGYGGYDPSTTAISVVEYEIFLHETGHNFGGSHESGNSAGTYPGTPGQGACSLGRGLNHADSLLPVSLGTTLEYSIMYLNTNGGAKQMVFTDGGTVNPDSTRNNVCVINADVLRKTTGNAATPDCTQGPTSVISII